jgi:cytochrome oxidase Cu insertion factor (SCO1/SenC/PrrC family)
MRALQRIGILAAVTVGLVAAIGLGIAIVEAAGNPFDAMGVDRVAEATSAPDLAFRSLGGREVRLRDLRGKVVLLGFFTTD